jgi:hypothetical protein
MKRIVVQLSGMPFDPTYEIDDDTIAIGDLVRVPGSGSAFIQDGETGTCTARILDWVVDLHCRQQAGDSDGWLGGYCSRSSTR